jgi:chaperonin GroEL
MSDGTRVNVTNVTTGKEAREKIKKGVDIAANAVKSTLGARGRNVVIEEGLMPHITKDGITVARSIFLDDPIENLGNLMVRQAGSQTVRDAGDGTTTSTVLVQAMVDYGMKLIDSGANPVQIQREMQEAASELIKEIESHSREVTDDMVKDIAVISSNGDKEVGLAIAEAFLAVGENGVVSPTGSKDHTTYVDLVEGMQIKAGYCHREFVNNPIKSIAVHNNPLIAVLDMDLDSDPNAIVPMLEVAMGESRPLVIIARKIEGAVFGFLAKNYREGNLNVLPIKAPGRGEHQREYIEDLAIATGATLISPKTGVDISSFKLSQFGTAEEVKAGYRTTTIIGGAGDKNAVVERIEGLQVMVEEAPEGIVKEGFQDRLGRLKGRIAVLYVGGSSDMEIREKADRVDDALGATQAAIQEGIVPGGGAMLNFLGMQRKGKEAGSGKGVVYRACLEPMRCILANGGIELESLKADTPNRGIDVRNGEEVNMIEAGIIDPAKVVKSCIRNASSVAGMILTTESTINNLRS